MSTEQPESSLSQGENTQQATSPTPTAKPAKNPKRVVTGKLVAQKTRLARKAQKKAAAEAAVIIANNKAKAPSLLSLQQPRLPKTKALQEAVSAPPNGLLLAVFSFH